jgi:hypothetical protein
MRLTDKFHAELLKDMFGVRKDSLVTDQYAVLRYDGVQSSLAPSSQALPPSLNKSLSLLDHSSLHPFFFITPPPSTEQETLEIHFGLTSSRLFRAFVNGSSWENEGVQRRASLYDLHNSHNQQKPFEPEEFIITKKGYHVWDLIINNLDEGDHTMHVRHQHEESNRGDLCADWCILFSSSPFFPEQLHGYTPFVLGTGRGFYQHSPNPQWGETLDLTQKFDNPMRRDVFVVPAYGWVVVRIILDNPGIWAFHCHVSWHQAIGFMTQINVQPEITLRQTIPSANMAQCRY